MKFRGRWSFWDRSGDWWGTVLLVFGVLFFVWLVYAVFGGVFPAYRTGRPGEKIGAFFGGGGGSRRRGAAVDVWLSPRFPARRNTPTSTS